MFLNKKKDFYLKRSNTLDTQEENWKIEKNNLQRENKIVEEYHELVSKKEHISTSKKLIAFLFINCSVVELVALWATVMGVLSALETGITPDFSPLLALIGAIVGEIIGYAIYSLKAMKENTKDGITYDTAMLNLQNQYASLQNNESKIEDEDEEEEIEDEEILTTEEDTNGGGIFG